MTNKQPIDALPEEPPAIDPKNLGGDITSSPQRKLGVVAIVLPEKFVQEQPTSA